MPTKANQAWSLEPKDRAEGGDFAQYQPADGTKFRALTVVDVFISEALTIEIGQRLIGGNDVEALNR